MLVLLSSSKRLIYKVGLVADVCCRHGSSIQTRWTTCDGFIRSQTSSAMERSGELGNFIGML
jgi:hypothetical protein